MQIEINENYDQKKSDWIPGVPLFILWPSNSGWSPGQPAALAQGVRKGKSILLGNEARTEGKI